MFLAGESSTFFDTEHFPRPLALPRGLDVLTDPGLSGRGAVGGEFPGREMFVLCLMDEEGGGGGGDVGGIDEAEDLRRGF